MSQNNLNDEVDNAILLWISTFPNLSSQPDQIDDLKDGIILTEIMHELDPKLFDLQKLTYDTENNWVLCMNNLDLLIKGIEMYYIENLQKPFDPSYIDAIKLAKGEDKE